MMLSFFLRVVAMVLIAFSLVGGAHAATLGFNGGGVAQCSLSGTTYTCNNNFLGATDTIAIASGYTVSVKGGLTLAYAQGLSMSGSARLESPAKSDIDLSASVNLNVAGGTIEAGRAFLFGANPQSITANIIAGTVTTSGASTSITGSVTATGAITLGSSSTITGNVSGASISTDNSAVIGGTLNVTGLASLGSGAKVGGAVSAGSVTSGSPAQFGGTITANTTIDLGSGTTVAGAISGTVITTGSPVTLNGAVTAQTSFTLASGSSVTGNIKAPTVTLDASGSTVKGTITAASALDIGSGNTVNGNISGATLTLRASGVVVNGNASFSGDVDIGSSTTINGDLAARNVTTHASGDAINGNAAVNAIFLDYGSTVSKTITCTGAGATGCSCVTSADPSYKPMCGAPPASAAHHIRITHGGTALTCQPETVTLTACANAACTAPHFSGDTQVTLQPGGGVFTISGGTNNAATVRQSTAGTATLTASGGGSIGASTCVNSASGTSSCAMTFSDNGLSISVPDHVAMTNADVTVQALKSVNNGKSCVPLVAKQKVAINFSCTYNNPTTSAGAATVPLLMHDRNDTSAVDVGVACGGAGTDVSLLFDVNGKATANLQYAEVGNVGLKAAYTAAGLGASTPGAVGFTTAPDRFVLTAKRVASTPVLGAGAFARASELFTLTAAAVNADGKTVTKNFGKEQNAENFEFAAVVTAPAGGVGQLSASSSQPINDGVHTGQYSFDQTGVVKLTARLLRSDHNYMGISSTGFQPTGELVLDHFVPDHFDTVLMTDSEISAGAPSQKDGRTMSCASMNASIRPCPDATGSFIHSLQPFFVKVLAYNGAAPAALTTNYSGDQAKPVTLSTWTAAGGATAWRHVNPSAEPLTWSGAAGATAFTFNQGVGTPADPVGNLPRLDLRGAYPGADTLPVTTYLRATDSDGASSQRAPGAAAAAASVEAQLTVVSGRLAIANAYGSPNTSLPVEARAQYYMPIGYVFNPQVQLTSASLGAYIKFNNCVNGLAGYCPSMKAATAPDTLVLKDGKGVFRIAPPSPVPAKTGAVDVSLPSLIPYLPSSVGRATFGIYRTGPVIYRRELY